MRWVLILLPLFLATASCAARTTASGPPLEESEIYAAALAHLMTSPRYANQRLQLDLQRAPFRDEYRLEGEKPPDPWGPADLEAVARVAAERSGTAALPLCPDPCRGREPGETAFRLSALRRAADGSALLAYDGGDSGGRGSFVLVLEEGPAGWEVTDEDFVMALDWVSEADAIGARKEGAPR